MRRLAWIAVLVAGAQAALACGRVLDGDDDGPPAPPVDGATLDGGPADGGHLDGAGADDAAPAGDAAPDAPREIVPICAPVFQDGFESSTWAQDRATTWPASGGSGGAFGLVMGARSGTRALRFATESRDSTVWLERAIDDTCPATIELWMKRRNNPGNSVTFFEVSGDGRRRTLRDLGSLLSVDAEPASDAGALRTATTPYAVGEWHRVVVRYELDGAMTVTVDDQSPLSFAASPGPPTPLNRLRIGILGGSGTSTGGNEVLFDDVLIY